MLLAAAMLSLGALALTPIPVLDPCALQDEPEKYNNQIVQVQGIVGSNFEIFHLSADGPRRCKPIWIEMGSAPSHVTSSVGSPGVFEPSETESFAKASEREFIDAVRDGKAREFFLEDLPKREWTPLTPVRSTPDRTWRGFLKKVQAEKKPGPGVICGSCPKYRVTATLEGRFDNAGKGFALRQRNGSVSFYHGYGHMNSYSSRIVVSRVVNFSATRWSSIPAPPPPKAEEAEPTKP